MSIWTPNREYLLRIHFSCIFHTYSWLHCKQSQVKQPQRALATIQASIQMLHLCHFLSNTTPVACLVALTSTYSFDYTSPSYTSITCWVGLQTVNNLTSVQGTHVSFSLGIQFSSCPQQLWLQNPRSIPASLPICTFCHKTHRTDLTPTSAYSTLQTFGPVLTGLSTTACAVCCFTGHRPVFWVPSQMFSFSWWLGTEDS